MSTARGHRRTWAARTLVTAVLLVAWGCSEASVTKSPVPVSTTVVETSRGRATLFELTSGRRHDFEGTTDPRPKGANVVNPEDFVTLVVGFEALSEDPLTNLEIGPNQEPTRIFPSDPTQPPAAYSTILVEGGEAATGGRRFRETITLHNVSLVTGRAYEVVLPLGFNGVTEAFRFSRTEF